MSEQLGEDQAALAEARAGGGLVPVAIGLAVYGVATYGYLGLAMRTLGPEASAPLSVLWSVLNGVGIGLFVPFEQELGRRTAERRERGLGNGPVVREAVRAAGVVMGVVAALTLVLSAVLAERLYGGHGELVLVTVLALAGMALSYVVRGVLSGNGRFVAYGAQFTVDGTLRVAAAAALWAAGVDSLIAFGLVLVAAPVLAVLVTTPWGRGVLVSPGPEHGRRQAATALGTLIGASLLAQVLANAGPVIVELLGGPGEADAAAQFLAALVVARVPLFTFAAVQAVLLPSLARAVATARPDVFRRQFGVVVGVTGAIGVLGIMAVWLVGTTVVPLLAGDAFGVDRGVITLIAASGAAQMIAQAIAQALLALDDERSVAWAWAVGLGALVVACAWTGPIAERAAWALLAGAGAALLALVAALVRAFRRWSRALGVPATTSTGEQA